MANEVELLSQILSNNIGNKLTMELAHGIVSVFNQNLPKIETPPPAEAMATEEPVPAAA